MDKLHAWVKDRPNRIKRARADEAKNRHTVKTRARKEGRAIASTAKKFLALIRK